jgi:hypothetical protein
LSHVAIHGAFFDVREAGTYMDVKASTLKRAQRRTKPQRWMLARGGASMDVRICISFPRLEQLKSSIILPNVAFLEQGELGLLRTLMHRRLREPLD